MLERPLGALPETTYIQNVVCPADDIARRPGRSQDGLDEAKRDLTGASARQKHALNRTARNAFRGYSVSGCSLCRSLCWEGVLLSRAGCFQSDSLWNHKALPQES
ncbi:hypothetical protein NDU88_007187 [Pleurodeles waltl]|uniref:Uncharacterized protein n=1 Tax=Pleurodeles waltl TaxID=8319 RepID=A0AAV7NSE2_PLEWA|nr:hypothetical protein NDU88_007187 [Pleurodeles waltl]